MIKTHNNDFSQKLTADKDVLEYIAQVDQTFNEMYEGQFDISVLLNILYHQSKSKGKEYHHGIFNYDRDDVREAIIIFQSTMSSI